MASPRPDAKAVRPTYRVWSLGVICGGAAADPLLSPSDARSDRNASLASRFDRQARRSKSNGHSQGGTSVRRLKFAKQIASDRQLTAGLKAKSDAAKSQLRFKGE